MSTIDKPEAPTTQAIPPKSVGRPGRRRNGTLADLDKELENQCREEQEGQLETSSSSKRPAKEKASEPKRKKKSKAAENESSNEDSSDQEESSATSSSDASVDSDEPRKKMKKSGFILFKGIGIISPDSKARFRKIQRLLESVANLVPKIDTEGKEALKEMASEVAEYRDFIKEVISSTRAEVPDRNPMKSKVVKQLKSLRDVLIELHEDLDPSSEMPMFGSHLLDWSDQEDLKKILGTKTARRLRTSLKGQKKLYKPIFKKSPAEIARTWLSADERRKKNFNSSSAGYSRDSARSGNSYPSKQTNAKRGFGKKQEWRK